MIVQFQKITASFNDRTNRSIDPYVDALKKKLKLIYEQLYFLWANKVLITFLLTFLDARGSSIRWF